MTNELMTEPMQMEEVIDTLKGLVFGTFNRTTAKEREALDVAIKVLEQQSCEDCISREDVIKWLKDKDIIKMNYQEENARRELAELPSITPTPYKADMRGEEE